MSSSKAIGGASVEEKHLSTSSSTPGTHLASAASGTFTSAPTSGTSRHLRSNSNPYPNAIPPRTSSSGLHTQSQRQTHTTNNNNNVITLTPVSEASWISSGADKGKQPQRQQRTAAKKPGRPTTIMQHQQSPSHTPDPERYAEEEFTERVSWGEDKERIVRGPFDYVSSHPGKDFRSQVIGAFNTWLEVPPASLEVITKVVGMLHEASLLVDDVQDSSELRRGFPVAHSIFGVAQTINSANYIYFCALQELIKLNNPVLLSTYAEELVNLHRGQGMDLFWRDTLTCPNEEDYLEMVGNKTGGLFRLGIKLMQAESSSKIDCVPLVDLVGLIFQIRDDYMNLHSDEYSNNKGMCEDLTEGKFSFPVIHSVRADPSNLQLINILKQKTTDVQVKRYAVSYMESKGSFEYTRQVITILIERARKTIEELEANFGKAPGLQKILDKMAIA